MFAPFNRRLGIDYKLNDKVTAGIQYTGNTNRNTTNDNINAHIYSYETGLPENVIATQGQGSRKTDFNSFNLHTTYSIDTTGTKLTLDADYFTHTTDNDRSFSTNIYDGSNSIIPGSYKAANNAGSREVDNFSVNADMEHPLRWVRLNYGGRLSNVRTENAFALYDLTAGVPVKDDTQSNEFIFRENTFAAFIDANKEFDQWEVKAGLRVESTRTKGKSVTTGQENKIEYTRFFPTAYIAYKPDGKNTLSLNYGKRIGRPSFELLNPFRVVSSPYSFSEGNPYLKPSYSHNVELSYGYDDYYSAGVYFSGNRGGFEQVTIVDPITKAQQYIPLNFVSSTVFGINQYIALEPADWFKFNFSADVYYGEAKSEIAVTRPFLKGWNGEFRLSTDFILNKSKTFLFNAGYFYVTPGVDNLDTNSSFSNLNMAVKLFLLEKKLQITLNGNDILRSSKTTYSGFSNGVQNTFANYNDQRLVRLSVLYNFGGSLKNMSQRESKNTDEQNRL